MLFRTIYARQCPVPARDLRSQLKHGLKCFYMNKMDILNNYCGTLICGYLFNFSLKLKKKRIALETQQIVTSYLQQLRCQSHIDQNKIIKYVLRTYHN